MEYPETAQEAQTFAGHQMAWVGSAELSWFHVDGSWGDFDWKESGLSDFGAGFAGL